MVQIQEASRFDLMVRMIANAARDHGPAVFVLGDTAEDLMIVDVIIRNRIPVALVAAGPDAGVLAAFVTRLYDLDATRVRTAETIERAVFGKNARITSRRGAAGNPLPPYEYDNVHGMLRFNPLAGWSEADVCACADVEGTGSFAAASGAASAHPDLHRIAA